MATFEPTRTLNALDRGNPRTNTSGNQTFSKILVSSQRQDLVPASKIGQVDGTFTFGAQPRMKYCQYRSQSRHSIDHTRENFMIMVDDHLFLSLGSESGSCCLS